MNRLFVDTGAWFALQVEDDAHHDEAAAVLPELLSLYARLTTTNHVIGETYTLLRISAGREPALRFLEYLDRSARLERIHVDESLEEKAWTLLHGCENHPMSFVDGVSFTVMEELGIGEAFAFDRHFTTAGFLRIPGDARPDDLR